MSGSKAKKARKDEKAAMRKDLKAQLKAATAAKDDKLAASKEHLVAQLEVTSDKYKTINGFMQARIAIKDVAFGTDTGPEFETMACELAADMSSMLADMAKEVDRTDVNKLDESIFEGLLDGEFISKPLGVRSSASQLLIVNMLQNMGGSIDDMVQFRVSTEEGIKTLEAELAKVDDEDKEPTAEKPELKAVE